MRITYDLLVAHNACIPQRDAFRALYPDGCEPTVEVLFDLAAEGLDAWWLWHLLPAEGPGSQRAYALWCAEQVAYLNPDARVVHCLDLVRRHVERQDVTPEQLAAAWAAAGDAAGDAAWAAAGDAARDAQLACLSDLLLGTCNPHCACADPKDPGAGCYGCPVYDAKSMEVAP